MRLAGRIFFIASKFPLSFMIFQQIEYFCHETCVFDYKLINLQNNINFVKYEDLVFIFYIINQTVLL